MQPMLSIGDLRDSRWRAVMWIVALQVLDIVTTYVAIKWTGASEGNPLVMWLVDTYLIILAKFAVAAFIIWRASKPKITVTSLAMCWFAVGTYVLAIVINTTVILAAA